MNNETEILITSHQIIREIKKIRSEQTPAQPLKNYKNPEILEKEEKGKYTEQIKNLEIAIKRSLSGHQFGMHPPRH